MKNIVVMKFGGSSVADADKIKHVADQVIAKKREGYNVVVVVSAPGDTTDDLVKMAYDITEAPLDREMDMLLATGEQISISLLSMAINHKGEDAISLTGAQVGVKTDKTHTKAKITEIHTHKLKKELSHGKIVIVAGFQGITPDDDITTLGRGGSDLTAVALSAVLKAYQCEIYTDVMGVFTTDPRLITDVTKIDTISYDEMLEMAGLGAQIMQARSIEVAKKYNVVIQVRSTFSDEQGTIITVEDSTMEDVLVRSIVFDRNQIKFSVTHIPDEPGVAAQIFQELAQAQINVDMIIQSAAEKGKNDISFTVHEQDFQKTLAILNKTKERLKAANIIYDDKAAKLSIIGVGMKSHTGVAAKMFTTLGNEKINIDMISTSEIKISCIISRDNVDKGVKALHKVFELNKKQ
ncbi:aspartate kinase [bacterium]